ncbi:MAG: MFS transporter, partial [Gammaproteobacteria bacterium]|nr:MFS transporter [Gammaproteobacteria bacterium]
FVGLKQMLKNPQMWYAGAIGCAMYMSLSLFAELWGIPFIHQVYSVSADKAAFACSMVFAGWLIGAPINGWLSDMMRTRKLPLIIGNGLAIIIITLIILKPIDISYYSLCTLLFLFGLASSAEIICFAVSRENNKTHVAATAVAFTNLLVMLGGMIFQPAVGKLLDIGWVGHMQHGIRVYSAHDYQHVLLLIPIILLLSFVLTFKLRETLR